MPSSLKRRFAGVLAALGAAATLGVVNAQPAHASTSGVYNVAGSPVYVRCTFDDERNALGRYDKIVYQGGNTDSVSCDIDQFRSSGDRRCIKYSGPGWADGWYKISANYWYKVSDFATVGVHSFYHSSCEGRPYFRHDGPGGIPATA